MSRVLRHSDRPGTEAALDLVEETLASLRRRVERQHHHHQGREGRVKDAATTTTHPPPPPPPPSSVTSSKSSKKTKNKSVLIKRKAKSKGKRTKHANSSSVHENLGTHGLEEEGEKAPEKHCRHCNPRREGGQSKAGQASQDRRTTQVTRASPSPDLPVMRERIVWKHGKRGHRRKESVDSSQDCLYRGNTFGPLYGDSDPADGRKRIVWKHGKRSHKRREEFEHDNQDHFCHCDTCKAQRSDRPLHDDPEPARVHEVLWRHGKRCHSRREDSDSSCHSNNRKTHRRTRSCAKPKHTAQEDDSADIGKSRERQEKRIKDAKNQACKYNEEVKERARRAVTHPRAAAVDVEQQGFAQPTLASTHRTDHSRPRKQQKENLIPYIPCGSKSHSYHVGIIAQQEMGRLISQPLQDYHPTSQPLQDPSHTRLQGSGRQEGEAPPGLTEETVRQAMTNLHHHLRSHTAHADHHL